MGVLGLNTRPPLPRHPLECQEFSTSAREPKAARDAPMVTGHGPTAAPRKNYVLRINSVLFLAAPDQMIYLGIHLPRLLSF